MTHFENDEEESNNVILVLDESFGSRNLTKFYRTLPFIDSKLINNFQYLKLFKDELKCHRSPQLLYRATRDSFSCASFHEKCDNHFKVVIIVKSDDGDLFGGFTTLSLNYSPSGQRRDEGLFTFRLEQNQLHLFKLKPEHYDVALFRYASQYLFAFGYMFWISENSNMNLISGTHEQIATAIEPECLLKGEKKRYFGGTNFKVVELEVFKIFTQ